MRRGISRTRMAMLAGTLLGFAFATPVPAQEQLWKSFGDVSGGLYGEVVANAGDVNGDGFDDVIIGARAAGMVRVVSGLDGTVIHTLYGSSSTEQFGFSVCGIGDVDGDQHADFAVGAPFYGTKRWVGRVSVYSGQTGTLLYHVQRGGFDRLGYALAPTGDMNGDGVPDFVISSVYGLYAEIVSGVDGSTVRTLKPTGGAPLFFGYAMATGGDVDGDGVGDILVGDPDSQDLGWVNGSVWIFSGADGSVIRQIQGGGGFFGGAVAMAGDVNGDGHCDALIGAPDESTVASKGGQATLCSGRDGSVLMTFAPTAPTQANWNLCTSVAGVGDLNRDGFADLLVGTPGYSDVGGGSGTVFLYSGRDGLPLHHFEDWTGTDPKLFGQGLAVTGDVTGDGLREICVGASIESSPTLASAGSVSLDRGNDLWVDVTPHHATANDALEVDVGQGAAGGLYALLLLDLNGAPVSTFLAIGALDATGRSTLLATVPPGLGTMTADFKAFAFDTRQKLIDSGVERLYLH